MTQFDSLLSKYISKFMSWDNLVTLVMTMKAGQPNYDQTPSRVMTLTFMDPCVIIQIL